MERLNQMSLKKAFFCLTLLFLIISLMLSAVSVWVISKTLQHYGSAIEIRIDGSNNVIPPASTESALPLWYHVLGILQLALPILFVTAGLLSAAYAFYRLKLKKPLADLQSGAEHIMKNDLDFTIQSASQDELGDLCVAFEKMRRELLKNNRELWRQAEERRRLNAAFSHDLRNPVTVLKGSAKMLQKELSGGALLSQSMKDSVSLIGEYIGRIEDYIEAMSSIQRLEELQCSPKIINLEVISKELPESIRLLTMDSGIKVEEQIGRLPKEALLDKAIVYNVAENLIMNAIRFAKDKIIVRLTADAGTLILSVEDNGPGFPQAILKKGDEPFLRGDEGNVPGSHFGMGLYVCRLLCAKHGGSLQLQNTAKGALATAAFEIS